MNKLNLAHQITLVLVTLLVDGMNGHVYSAAYNFCSVTQEKSKKRIFYFIYNLIKKEKKQKYGDECSLWSSVAPLILRNPIFSKYKTSVNPVFLKHRSIRGL